MTGHHCLASNWEPAAVGSVSETGCYVTEVSILAGSQLLQGQCQPQNDCGFGLWLPKESQVVLSLYQQQAANHWSFQIGWRSSLNFSHDVTIIVVFLGFPYLIFCPQLPAHKTISWLPTQLLLEAWASKTWFFNWLSCITKASWVNFFLPSQAQASTLASSEADVNPAG